VKLTKESVEDKKNLAWYLTKIVVVGNQSTFFHSFQISLLVYDVTNFLQENSEYLAGVSVCSLSSIKSMTNDFIVSFKDQ
jgi:hypothetical protein